MKGFWCWDNLLLSLVLIFVANSFLLVREQPLWLLLIVPLLLAVHLLSGVLSRGVYGRRLKLCYHGGCLLGIFAASLLPSIAWHVLLSVKLLPSDWRTLLWSALYCVVVEALVFWHGVLCVYLTSAQMGIRRRVLCAVAGMIPLVNLVALGVILSVVFREVRFETEKALLNESRAAQRVCATKYPILLVHGVFFRDSRLFNYWGRIPSELKKNGARVFYGEHDSARPVAESAAELLDRIEWIVKKTGCEKVNVIAHSKGGLDTRYAIAHLGAAPYIASLTTVNTPHNGCIFADYLLKNLPRRLVDRVTGAYNAIAEKAGDECPDFLAAVTDLTAPVCVERNKAMPTPDGILCRSVGTKLNGAMSGRFPLNFSYHLVKHFDGPNDGLVSLDCFPWGEEYTLLTVKGRRGISHCDIVDMNRENLPEFDVREFYVGLVSDLKERGL